MVKAIDHTGQKFGRLTVIGRAESNARGLAFWNCKCDCGNLVVAMGSRLRTGVLNSCGCIRVENCKILASKKITHGMAHSSEYRIWRGMIVRCENTTSPKHARWGGRGITVCDRWLRSFENFLPDMGKKPNRLSTIERIDNDGNYEPSNCRWATRKEQAANTMNNVIYTHDGVSMCLAAWAEKTGINRYTLYYRYKAGKRGMELLSHVTT